MQNDSGNKTPAPVKPNPEGRPPKFLWLFCAFAPSLIAIPMLNAAVPALAPLLFGLNVLCSLSAGIGLVRGITSEIARFFLGLFLAGIFFVLNVMIVIFVGCSHIRY